MSLWFLLVYLALWIVVIVMGVVVVGLVRELSDLRRLAVGGRLPQRLAIGARAPRISGPDVRSHAIVDSAQLSGRELVVLFLSPDCRVCRRLADGVRSLPVEPGQARIAVCRGTVAGAAPFIQTLAPDVSILLDEDGSTQATYGVSGTPVAFVLDGEGRVQGSSSPHHAGELQELIVASRRAGAEAASPVPTGA
jgi:hypothetical protein